VYRTIPVPDNANSREANVYFKDGVLHVTFPKLANANVSSHRKLTIGDAPQHVKKGKTDKHVQNRNN